MVDRFFRRQRRQRRTALWVAGGLTAGLLVPLAAEARVKLTMLPVRERVEVQLDHEQATLIEEERVVPLVAGENQIDFSWKNTRIDPGSIVFRVLGPADEGAPQQIHVLSVAYPPQEQALVWQVAALRAGSARVRISYLLSGLEKNFHYRAVAGEDEKTLQLSQYIRIRNFAGEAYAATEILAGYGETFQRPIGLNETREMLVSRIESLPVVKTYTVDAAVHGYLDRTQDKLNVPMHYVLGNHAEAGLGQTALPAGKVRIFQQDGRGTTAFLGEDWGSFTPVGGEMGLYLGLAQDVVAVRRIETRHRERVAGNLHHGEVLLRYEMENFKTQPVQLNVVEQIEALRQEAGFATGQAASWTIGPKTTFSDGPDPEKSHGDQVQFRAELPGRAGDRAEKVVFQLHLIFAHQW